ncbi:MAG: hypothetical protein WC796_06255 [Candidatus Pacearchaeota archaeon]
MTLRRSLALTLGIGVAAWTTFFGGCNLYQHQNVRYETPDRKVFEKADGILGYTKLDVDKNTGAVEITRHHGWHYRDFTDSNGDGFVDRVCLGENPFIRGSHITFFDREKQLQEYPVVFRDADNEFRNQMQRFEPLMDK